MSQEDKHTPLETPWIVSASARGLVEILSTPLPGRHMERCVARVWKHGHSEIAISRANTIVTAVNSYAYSQAEIARLKDSLRRIAEGNLGDDPWQANYARIRQVAVEALSEIK